MALTFKGPSCRVCMAPILAVLGPDRCQRCDHHFRKKLRARPHWRTQRRLRAEEAAAKLPVKLLIPLVFCIFPALLTVMLGPVGVSLYNHFSKQA